jgi:hypothetical protein
MHGKPPERHWVRETRSISFWGLLLPALALALAWHTRGISIGVLVALYVVLGIRIARHARRRQLSGRDARIYSVFCILAKFPQVIGAMKFWCGRLLARPSGLIEYK